MKAFPNLFNIYESYPLDIPIRKLGCILCSCTRCKCCIIDSECSEINKLLNENNDKWLCIKFCRSLFGYALYNDCICISETIFLPIKSYCGEGYEF